MFKSLILPVATMALKVLAPKSADIVGKIQTVTEVALPIVAKVAKTNATNDDKWGVAVDMVQKELAQNYRIRNLAKENIIESGVQLAYSIFKGQK